MDDLDLLLTEFDEEEMTELLSEIDIEEFGEINEKIKANVIAAINDRDKKAKIKFFTPKKILAFAASIAVVIAATFITVEYMNREPIRSDLPTISSQGSAAPTESTTFKMNPLMYAIERGDESLINFLIKNTAFLSEEVMKIALQCVDLISYSSVNKIATATFETIGTTGLDSLLESTILGDSKRALEELKKRKNMLMTPSEKLAFFFSAAFCDSEVVSEFLNRGYDKSMTNSNGKTALQIAEKYGNKETAKLLGANV